MTINKFLRVLKENIYRLNTWDIPLKLNGREIIDMSVHIQTDEEGGCVDLVITEKEKENDS